MEAMISDDIWDNLIRIKSPIVAAELLELSLGDDRWASWEYEDDRHELD